MTSGKQWRRKRFGSKGNHITHGRFNDIYCKLDRTWTWHPIPKKPMVWPPFLKQYPVSCIPKKANGLTTVFPQTVVQPICTTHHWLRWIFGLVQRSWTCTVSGVWQWRLHLRSGQ
jgi:hypothetical protein